MIVCHRDQGKTKGLDPPNFFPNCPFTEQLLPQQFAFDCLTLYYRRPQSMAKKISELAQLLDASIVGDGEIEVNRVASLESATTGDIAYLDDAKFFEAATKSKASCVIFGTD